MEGRIAEATPRKEDKNMFYQIAELTDWTQDNFNNEADEMLMTIEEYEEYKQTEEYTSTQEALKRFLNE